jgi:hypothetical protein
LGKRIQDTANMYLGSNGFFSNNMDIAMDKASFTSNDALEAISQSTGKAISKADMSSSGTVIHMDKMQTDKVSKDYKLSVNEAVNQRRQDEFNLLSNLQKQKNALMADYVTTTEESYSGEFTEFDKMFEDMDRYSRYENPYDI